MLRARGGRVSTRKGLGVLQRDENLLYVDCGSGYMSIYIVKTHQNIDLTWVYFAEWCYASIKLASGISDMRQRVLTRPTLRYEAGTHHQREPPRGSPFRLYPFHSPLCCVSEFAPPPSILLCVQEADWSGLHGGRPASGLPVRSARSRHQQELRGRRIGSCCRPPVPLD